VLFNVTDELEWKRLTRADASRVAAAEAAAVKVAAASEAASSSARMAAQMEAAAATLWEQEQQRAWEAGEGGDGEWQEEVQPAAVAPITVPTIHFPPKGLHWTIVGHEVRRSRRRLRARTHARTCAHVWRAP
jgi:hypothetical protein